MSNTTNEGQGAAAGGADSAAAAAAAGAAGAGAGTAAGAAGGAAGAGSAAGGAFSSAAASGAAAGGAEAGAAGTVPPLGERIPEKLRVLKADGTLDVEASAGKLLEGYGQLEKRLGTGDAPPKTVEEYAPKTERFDLDTLKGDPEYTGFLKAAHAKGITNDQLGFVLDTFADRLDKLGPLPMSTADFMADMKANHWKGEGEYEQNMALGLRTLRAFSPNLTAAELASIPNNPTIAKVLAAIGKELGEDRQILNLQPMSEGDFESQLAALQASEAYNNASHPEHKQALAKSDALFAKRYPSKAS